MERDRPVSLLLATTIALYATFALLPAVALMVSSGGWLWQRATLSPTEHFTPLVDGIGMIALIGVTFTALLSIVPAFALGVRRLPRDIRTGVGISLLAVHVPVMLGTLGSVAGVGVLPVLLDTERLVGRASEPAGPRAALLYRDNSKCSWTVYISEPLDPVAIQHSNQRCDCSDMREAHLVWTGANPDLLDPLGQPFTCPAPPSGCRTTPGPMLPALTLVALIALRRRFRAPCRAA